MSNNNIFENKEWEIVMGLEVHVELATQTKIFCACENKFESKFENKTNSHCCPVCSGMPGSLPVLNKQVLDYAIKAGLALNCAITRYNKFDRKNYYYPDLPKAYQISQLYLPFAKDGLIELENNKKNIRIHEIHMEEDAGKLVHDEIAGLSYLDYNRCGVPLLEIVSEPDFRNANEVLEYLNKIKLICEYLEISDCKMEEGSMRADVNLSVRKRGEEVFGTRSETKNLNSFKAIERAINYEAKRQIEVLEDGGIIKQETRRWDDDLGEGYAMRGKENAQDYRYFPDPDLPPILFSEEFIESIKNGLPELSHEKKLRYMNEFNLSEYDANILTNDKGFANLFEQTVKLCDVNVNEKFAKEVANWLIVHAMRLIKERNIDLNNIKINPRDLAKLIKIIDSGKINRTVGVNLFEKIFDGENINLDEYITENKLEMFGDEDKIREIAARVVAADLDGVKKYKDGKTKVFGAFVGQVMRELRGKANPDLVNKIVEDEIGKINV